MDISKLFEAKKVGLVHDLKIALVCTLCAVLPYYTAVYTIDYPYRRWLETDLFFYQIVIIKSLGEEAFFRLIPLAVVIHLFGARWLILIPLILAVSVYFSMLHNGLDSILALGPGSVLLAIAFLYYGGLEKKYLRGFIWCGAIHVAIGVVIFILVPIIFFD